MDFSAVTLCFPDNKKSCFACCPPIRQAGYEHIQYRRINERMLRENSRLFNRKEKRIIPITGFSCWALGYLDDRYSVIGCMLHPLQNNGDDLRFRTGYGKKCSRETCPEEKVFRLLNPEEKKFWLQLAGELDSFSYSSRRMNPLFRLLNWGIDILRIISARECGQGYTKEAFFRSYRFFMSEFSPRANAYLLKQIINAENVYLLKVGAFEKAFTSLPNRIIDWIKSLSISEYEGDYVHLLDLDPLFSDFLRLGAGIKKMDISKALAIKDYVDSQLGHFLKNSEL